MSNTRSKAAARKASHRSIFPPRPDGMKGRSAEVATLARTIAATRPTRIALVGSGGSGKSMLAAALGHRLRAAFGSRVLGLAAFEVAARRTLAMLAHIEGDHVDTVSLAKLARAARLGPALAELER
jgi:fructoselysine-6-P-deglycase FrlB-like protein